MRLFPSPRLLLLIDLLLIMMSLAFIIFGFGFVYFDTPNDPLFRDGAAEMVRSQFHKEINSKFSLLFQWVPYFIVMSIFYVGIYLRWDTLNDAAGARAAARKELEDRNMVRRGFNFDNNWAERISALLTVGAAFALLSAYSICQTYYSIWAIFNATH